MIAAKQWDLQRIRLRHRGYQLLLGLEVAILLLQPLANHWPPLNALLFISLAATIVFTLTRYTPLRSHRRASMLLGLLTISLEMIFLILIFLKLPLNTPLILLHLGVWLLYLSGQIYRMMRTLMREPYVTTGVVLGAASCYMLIAYCGALLMFSIALLDPGSFSLSFELQHSNYMEQIAYLPNMVLASFGYLTTVGAGIASPRTLTAVTATTLITLAGQLYVAILISLILGRFHHRKS